MNDGICDGCKALAYCDLPPAWLAKNQSEKS